MSTSRQQFTDLVARRLDDAATAALTSLRRATKEPERAAYLGAWSVNVISSVAGWEKPRKISKTALMPLLAVGVVRHRKEIGDVGTAALVSAAGLGWLGDLVLMPQKPNLNAGAVPFAGNHLIYQWLLHRAGARHDQVRTGARAVAWAGAAIACAASTPRFLPASLGYGAILGATSALGDDGRLLEGLPAPERDSADPRYAIGLGGNMFMLSDALLMLRAAIGEDTRAGHILDGGVMDTYALAQMLLIDGLCATEANRD
ncbi:lysoplasmalogenase [Corynebacterium sp. TAE3-ERU12]|uniref:lysoplasmalogenase n=1 Tax=Corynebacterium sp. TAE3-ERU12 TaxID=2849491 RepID=UPI001C43A5DC|nr:lysoplasmalogenase [Corynebacterium sp. TAE3-ERU12]MBV7295996.1 lysoplasmalogenase [Corynebacterium sp. TAE3-ERU12]